MNIIFMRHGEATDNAKGILSDKEIYWSVLTENGKDSVIKSVKILPSKIDKIYVSPFPRTIQTAHYIFNRFPKTEVYIDNRLHEIFYGKFSGQQNNEEIDKIREKQVAGDYFTRFGDYGENKFDIEWRLCSFLNDIYINNKNNETIVIVSHGSVTSFMKRILNIKTQHIQTGKVEVFNNIDISPVIKRIEELKNLKF